MVIKKCHLVLASAAHIKKMSFRKSMLWITQYVEYIEVKETKHQVDFFNYMYGIYFL